LDCSYAFAEVTGNKFSPGYSYVREVETSLIAHQLGHNLTLGHSSALQCDGAVETGSCQLIPEGDFYDVMGLSWGQLGSLNLVHASTFAVLFPWNMKSIYPSSPPETVTLAPVSDPSGVRAVQLWGGPGKATGWNTVLRPAGTPGSARRTTPDCRAASSFAQQRARGRTPPCCSTGRPRGSRVGTTTWTRPCPSAVRSVWRTATSPSPSRASRRPAPRFDCRARPRRPAGRRATGNDCRCRVPP
jgi:hypothetical protein